MTTEVPIVMIEAAPEAKIRKLAKGEHYNPYVKYAFPVVYVLEDGRRVETTDTFNLLRDAKARLATLPAPPERSMSADFDAEGKFWGTTTSFWIGGQR